MKSAAIKYSAAQLMWIYHNHKRPRKEAWEEFCKKFNRDDVTVNNFDSLCYRKGWLTGRDGCYKKGQVPVNKGQKMPYNENSARMQFKKGQMPHNTKYIGHERVTKDNYIEISVVEINPWTGAATHYVLKHRYLWEKEHGKLPTDMCLKCLDGNRQNCDVANWKAIPRGALPFLNGFRGYDYDNAPSELKPVILTLAKLKAKRKSLNNTVT